MALNTTKQATIWGPVIVIAILAGIVGKQCCGGVESKGPLTLSYLAFARELETDDKAIEKYKHLSAEWTGEIKELKVYEAGDGQVIIRPLPETHLAEVEAELTKAVGPIVRAGGFKSGDRVTFRGILTDYSTFLGSHSLKMVLQEMRKQPAAAAPAPPAVGKSAPGAAAAPPRPRLPAGEVIARLRALLSTIRANADLLQNKSRERADCASWGAWSRRLNSEMGSSPQEVRAAFRDLQLEAAPAGSAAEQAAGLIEKASIELFTLWQAHDRSICRGQASAADVRHFQGELRTSLKKAATLLPRR